MSRMYRGFLSALAILIAIGSANSVRAQIQCFTQENSHSTFDPRYGYYCIGTGPGCTFCWDEIEVG
ncbi:MAG TPA: hypothetical protein VEO54_08645 [Thermoanaerobaculia bacterium]|nr:hypothetical protein [Thermoanaerobaculia bacterium]